MGFLRVHFELREITHNTLTLTGNLIFLKSLKWPQAVISRPVIISTSRPENYTPPHPFPSLTHPELYTCKFDFLIKTWIAFGV